MNKTITFFLSIVLCIGCLANCTPSESAMQTAIASTKAVEDAILEETLVAQQAATQETLNMQSTKNAEIGQTQTVEAFSVAQTQEAIPRDCTPGGTYEDFEGDIGTDYLDILKIETSLENEVLTLVIHLKGLPDEITINKEEIESGTSEYYWGVSVDVDGDPDTGSNFSLAGNDLGYEYELSLFHFVRGNPQTGKIEDVLKGDALVWRAREDYTEQFGKANFEVDYELNTITISGSIPGINENSLLYFAAQEYYGFLPDSDYLCEKKQ